MKTHIKLLFLLILVGNISNAQKKTNGFPKLIGPYLGQKPPGNTPEIFAPGIVSTVSFEHSKISFTKDGNAFYWAAQPTLKTNIIQQRIWSIQKKGNVWSMPTELNIPQIGLASPTISSDGKKLFYTGSADRSATSPNQLVKELFVLDLESKRNDNISQQFPVLKGSWSFSIAENGDIYFDYSENNIWEIFVLRMQSGKYTQPEKLPSQINDGSQNIHPFISPDGSYLLFSSSRSGGYGSADLYVCFKDKNGKWTIVKNFGKTVNTDWRERFPSVSNDGKYLFFTRRNEDINDFYWVDTKVIEELRPKELK